MPHSNNLNPARRRMHRVSHELKLRNVTVSGICKLSPNFVAVTFYSPDFADFHSASFDDHVKFMFTNANGDEVRRDYTPVAFNQAACELTLQFALHQQGQASTWAKHARSGDTAVIGGPRGSMVMPPDYDWHLLTGDMTALPAIERRLAELPANSRVQAFVLLNNAADKRDLYTPEHTDIHWFTTPDELLHAFRALTLAPGEGLIWGAGEAELMKQVKDICTNIHQHPAQGIRIGAYWKYDSEDFRHYDL